MAQLVLGVAGAVVGGMIGGPVGAQIGWMAGAAIGGIVGAEDVEGPRLSDKRVQSNAYGNSIPLAYGKVRVPAQLIWASDLIETAREEGGKGGPSVTSYSYSIDMLVSCCESGTYDLGISGDDGAGFKQPLRIWANGRLLWTYDGTDDGVVDEELIVAGNVRWYDGRPTQQPDPVYEAAVGAENAPAYRGQTTIMLEGLQLAFAGNRPPQIEVEVGSVYALDSCPLQLAYGTAHERDKMNASTNGSWGEASGASAYDAQLKRLYVLTENNTDNGQSKFWIDAYDVTTFPPTLVDTWALVNAGTAGNAATNGTFPTSICIDPVNREVWVTMGAQADSPDLGLGLPCAHTLYLDSDEVWATGVRFYAYYWALPNVWVKQWDNFGGDCSTGLKGGNGSYYGATPYPLPDYSTYRGGSGGAVGWANSGTAFLYVFPSIYFNPGCALPVRTTHVFTNDLCNAAHYVPAADAHRGGGTFATTWRNEHYWIDHEGNATLITLAQPHPFGQYDETMVSIAHSAARERLYCARKWGSTSYIAQLDLSINGSEFEFATPFTEVPPETRTLLHGSVGIELPRFCYLDSQDVLVAVWTSSSGAARAVNIAYLDPDTYEVLYHCSSPAPFGGGWAAKVYHVEGSTFACAWVNGHNRLDGLGVVTIQGPSSQLVETYIKLWQIVRDICVRSGLTPSQIDVSELLDDVRGYIVNRPVTGRAVIDQLRGAYFFDGVESSDVLRFPKRGASAAATLDDTDLGTRLITDTTTPVARSTEHITADLEAPREYSVAYLDYVADYDTGVQTARRSTTGATAPMRSEFPIVFVADEASKVAWTNLMLAHAAKDQITVTLTHEFEALEPTDAINVPFADGQTRRVRLIEKSSERPLLEFRGIIESQHLFDLVYTGGERGQLPTQQTPLPAADTMLAVLDIPPLRASDANSLYQYLAVGPTAEGAWSGAAVYKSLNSGSTYSKVNVLENATTIGALTEPMAAWTGGNRWDRTTEVYVTVYGGTLASADDIDVLNGANACVIGQEIVQFAEAELVGTNTYKLTRLLRHRIGTEWAASTVKPAGTTFVLLSELSMRTHEYGLGLVGKDALWKGVGSGQAVADVAAQTVSHDGNTLKPLSPVWITGTREENGDLTISWVRRARINAQWMDSYDVPLDEPTEAYEVDIYSDGSPTVARTLTSATTSVTYTAAQQAEDFGGSPTPASFSIAVYQISAIIGRGHAGTATI